MLPESRLNIVAAKKTRKSLGNPIDVDSNGLLIDIDIQPIDDSRQSFEDKRRDINEFFHPAVVKIINGRAKKYSTCKLLSPDGTPTQLQGSVSRPLARRRGEWKRREGKQLILCP